jgi:hypothetical protein
MKIPNNEKIMLTYVFEGVDCYAVTQNALGKYVLYKITNNDWQKLKTSDSAANFDEIVNRDRSK